MLNTIATVFAYLLLIEVIYGILFKKDPIFFSFLGVESVLGVGSVLRFWALWLMRLCLVAMSIATLQYTAATLQYTALSGSTSTFGGIWYNLPMFFAYLLFMTFMWPKLKTSSKA